MKLIIQGSDKKVKRLAKELELRVKRNGLKMSLAEDKKQEVEKPPVKKEKEPQRPPARTVKGSKKAK